MKIIEPIATVTNAAYAVAGVAVLERAATTPDAMVGVSMILLAVGSGIFHGARGSLKRTGQSLDEIGMYAVVIALMAKGVAAVAGPSIVLSAAALFIFTGAAVFHQDRRVDSFVLIPSGVVIVTLLVWAVHSWETALVIAASFGVVAFARMAVDPRHGPAALVASPHAALIEDVVHGAVWHLGSAVAAYAAWAALSTT